MAPKGKKLDLTVTYGDYHPGQRVMGKLHNYPFWPAFIPEYKHLNKNVLKSRKDSSRIPVMFFPEGEYGWVKKEQIIDLTDDELKEQRANIPNIDDPMLIESLTDVSEYTYESFREFKGLDPDENNGLFDDNIEVDQEPPAKKSAAKVSGKPGPKTSVTTKSSVSTDRKRKVAEQPTSTVSEADKNRDYAWSFRYNLQKGLIQGKTECTERELRDANNHLDKLEKFSDEGKLTVEILGHTKLHKVLREILKKKHLAKDPYNLQERSKKLLVKWAPLVEELRKEKHGNGGNNSHQHTRDLSDVSHTKKGEDNEE